MPTPTRTPEAAAFAAALADNDTALVAVLKTMLDDELDNLARAAEHLRFEAVEIARQRTEGILDDDVDGED